MPKSNKGNELKKIHIKWIDSVGTGGWVNDHQDADMRCETVGFWLSETKDMVKVALNKSHCGEKSFGHYIQIPKVAIKGRRWVR